MRRDFPGAGPSGTLPLGSAHGRGRRPEHGLVRLFLDQGVPRRTAVILREAGVDTVHAGEVGLSMAQDRANEAVVVTLDADFHAQIALSGETSPSAIRFRLQ